MAFAACGALRDGHLDKSVALLRPDGVQGSCIFIHKLSVCFLHIKRVCLANSAFAPDS